MLKPPGRTGPVRSWSLALWLPLPSLFGLAPCGVYPAPGVTAGAVRSYRTISPLPRRGLAVQANLSGLSGSPSNRGVAEAVSFLWHWPSTDLEARVPDVIRHTALRSSDFPPPLNTLARDSGSDRPVLLPVISLSRKPIRLCRRKTIHPLGFESACPVPPSCNCGRYLSLFQRRRRLVRISSIMVFAPSQRRTQ